MSTHVETFTKANGADWGPDLTWTTLNGNPRVESNYARNGTANGDEAIGRAEHGVGSPDMWVEARDVILGGGSVDSRMALLLRCSTDAWASIDCYYAEAQRRTGGVTRYRIYKRVAGVDTLIAGPVDGTQVPNNSNSRSHLRFEAIGAELAFKFNGETVLSVTDATIIAGDRGGLWLWENVESSGHIAATSTWRVSNFEIETTDTYEVPGAAGVGLYEWEVPPGVTSVEVDVYGAKGGGSTGGLGARVQATVPVTPGEVLELRVGRAASSVNEEEYGGGRGGSFFSFAAFGGGGASDIRRTPYGLADRIVVAGAGGGRGESSGVGAGGDGGETGEAGDNGGGGTGGGGGQAASGGTAGTGIGSSGGTPATAGDFEQGGAGYDPAGFEGSTGGGGGGGGGWYGGGGGGERSGGGGGSSHVVDGASGIVYTDGTNSGNGSIALTYTPDLSPEPDECVTYEESFTKADGALGPDLTWITSFAGWKDLVVKDNDCASADFTGADAGEGLAVADHQSVSDDVYVECLTGQFFSSAGGGDLTGSFFAWGLWVRADPAGDETKGYSARFHQVFGATNGTISLYRGLNDVLLASVSQPLATGSAKVCRLEADGNTLRVYFDGILVLTVNDSVNPTGRYGGITTGSGGLQGSEAITKMLADFEFGDLCLHPIPPEVPYIVANERGQLIACVNAGNSTDAAHPTPEWRYWFAGPPLWAEGLAGDEPGSLPAWYALDENGDREEAALTTRDVEVGKAKDGTRQEATIEGVVVWYVPRPAALDDLDGGQGSSLAMNVRVVGFGVADVERLDDGSRRSGVVASDAIALTLVPDDQSSDRWPNLRAAYFPVRLGQRVRSYRVEITGIRGMEIKKIKVLGHPEPMRLS